MSINSPSGPKPITDRSKSARSTPKGRAGIACDARFLASRTSTNVGFGVVVAAMLAIGKAKLAIQFRFRRSEFSCEGWMPTVARFLLIISLIGIGPALSGMGGSTDSPQAASTIDHTPPGTLNPEPLPPLANPNAPNLPAKELFARKSTPLPGPPRAIGSYADGCLAGAVALPITGPTWQVMRLSRDRN